MKNDITDIINKIYSNNNDSFIKIINSLQQIIDDTQEVFIKQKENNNEINNEIDLDEEKRNKDFDSNYLDINTDKKTETEIKLGEKRKKQLISDENLYDKDDAINEDIKNKEIKNKSEVSNCKRCIIEMIKRIKTIIVKMNSIINEKNNNKEIIINLISTLENQQKEKAKEIIYDDGKYIGQIVNGIKEGKGIFYYNDGDKYEGEWKNDTKEGKGVYYFKKGDKYEGDWKNDNMEGKGVYYYISGNRYEGDWKNDKHEGNGIFYYYNGDREMGDYFNGSPIGKHITLTRVGEIQINNY